jgi:UDP-glucose 4-epimerase
MKRIAVTGALGHIGSGFIRSLRQGMYDRVDLVCRPTSDRFAGLLQLPFDVPFRCVHADICEDDLDAVAKGVDVIVHLAAITASNDPALLRRVNVVGTSRLAAACARHGTRLIFISTTSVYAGRDGNVLEVTPNQDYLPHSPYALSKWQAERVLLDMSRDSGLNVTICRFGTVYGPSYGMRFHTAVNKFVWQACIDQPLTVWRTSIDQRRPYLHVDDAVRALGFVIELDENPGVILDVASDTATVHDVIEILSQLFADLRVEFIDSPLMNTHSFSVDCDPLRHMGFEFQGDLGGGISETARWLRGLCDRRLTLHYARQADRVRRAG